MNNDMTPGTQVRFSSQFFSDLITRAMRSRSRHIGDLDQIQMSGMTVQGEPRPGRINVTFNLRGMQMYRTYAARDLAVIAQS